MLKPKPFGVALGLLGNIAVGIAIHNMVGTGSCGGELPACPDSLTPSFILLPAGIIISMIAIFIGGGGVTFIGLFMAIGIGSIAAGLGSEEDETKSFSLIFGGGFVGVPLLLVGFGVFFSRKTVAKVKKATRLDGTDANLRQVAPDIAALFEKAASDDGPSHELAKLAELRSKGVLTDAEFEAAKARVLKL